MKIYRLIQVYVDSRVSYFCTAKHIFDIFQHRRAVHSICESSFLIRHGGYRDLFVCL